MSIEQALQNLADAINNHADALRGKGQFAIDFTKGQHSEHTSGKPEKAAEIPKTDAKPASASSQPSAAAPASAPAEKADSFEKPLDYEKDLKPRFLKMVEVCGRTAAVELMHSYKAGATKLVDAVTPAQYAEVLAKINAAIAAKS